MSGGVALSLLINVLVGAYLFWLYPRTVQKIFANRRVPRAFALLARVLPVAGAVLMAGSVVYALLVIGGVVVP